MKKYIIIVILLLAVAVVIQMKIKKINIPQTTQQPSSEIKIGREIERENIPKPPPEPAMPPTYSQLTGCSKTFQDIIAEYGKEWGPIQSKKLTFTPEETNNILKLVDDYLICKALTSNDPSNCKLSLTKEGKEGCEKYYYTYRFVEFIVGANKDERECLAYLNFIRDYNDEDKKEIKNLLRLSQAEKICLAIKHNPTKVCDNILAKDEEKKRCYQVFPNDLTKGCFFFPTELCKEVYEKSKGDIDCNWFDDYNKELCEMKKIGGSICTDKLQKLLITYCSYQENVKKKLTEFEEKKRLEEEKIQAEKEKLKKAKEEEERKKLEEEIIKKAKEAVEKAKKFKGRKYEEE